MSRRVRGGAVERGAGAIVDEVGRLLRMRPEVLREVGEDRETVQLIAEDIAGRVLAAASPAHDKTTRRRRWRS